MRGARRSPRSFPKLYRMSMAYTPRQRPTWSDCFTAFLPGVGVGTAVNILLFPCLFTWYVVLGSALASVVLMALLRRSGRL